MPILTPPRPDQHYALIGANGSGKSKLAEVLLSCEERYFAIDTQDSLNIPGKVLHNPEYLKYKLQFSMYDKIRYVPRREWRNRDSWNYILSTIGDSSSRKKRHKRRVYIDEAYHVGYGISFPTELPILYSTGRQKHIGVGVSAQRPVYIPKPLLSESKFIYVFYLSREDDIKEMAGMVRKDSRGFRDALSNQEQDFSFIVIDVAKGTWEKYPPLVLQKK